MSSETAPQDTSAVNESATEPDEKVIGGRATPDEIYLIDRAALEVGQKRGPFIVEAAIEKARTIMAAKSAIEQAVPRSA